MPRTARRRVGGPRPVSEVIDSILSQPMLFRGVAVKKILNAWPSLVGDALAARSRPVLLKAGILLIAADSAPEAHSIQYLKMLIVERIRAEMPELGVRDIRVVNQPAKDGPR